MDTGAGDAPPNGGSGPTIHPPPTKSAADDESDYCRICRGEGTIPQPLFYPCKCSGSIKYVHQECLMEWLSHSQKKYCELCKTPFRFTKLYDQRMPATLPLPLFIQHLTAHGFRTFSRWIRYLVVGFVWLCWLPWSIRQVWRGLFWVADGGWFSEREVQRLVTAQVGEVGNQNAATAAGALQSAVNATLRASVFQAIPQALAPAFSFLGYSADEMLVVKLFKFTFPNTFRWSPSVMGSTNSTVSLLSEQWQRRPSLLSDVEYFSAVTGYKLLDNVLLDVFEGQVICLFIIIAFVLVFLIREWVINQQPILNMPDVNQVEVDVANLPIAEGAAQPPRRRNRFRPRVGDPPNNGPEGGAARMFLRPRADAQRPRPPQPQRAATEGGLATEMAAVASARHAHRARSASLQHNSPPTTSDPSLQVSQDPEEGLGGQSPITRPPLTPRGALDNAVNIHRSLEEGVDPTNRSLLASDTDLPASLVEQSLAEGSNSTPTTEPHSFASARSSATFTDPVQMWDYSKVGGSVLRRPSSSLERLPDEDLEPGTGCWEGAAIGAGGRDMPSVEQTNLRGVDAEDSVDARSSSDDLEVYTPSPSESAASQPVSSGHADLAEVHPEGPAASTDDSDRKSLSILESICGWMWHIDQEVPERQPSPLPDVTAIVEDLEAEQPFVPVQRQVQLDVANDGTGELPEEPAAPPNAHLEEPPNDAEAIEDAEDLDGILELIGFQGPIVAMVQNVIFSEFLITLTIAASVWLPYIWGKIALLIMVNPVGVFVRAPVYLTASMLDLAVDVCLFVVGLCGSTLDWALSALKLALSPTVSGSYELFNTTSVTRAFSSLANNSGSRLENTLSKMLMGLKPDYLAFSMQSHHALHGFKMWIRELMTLGTYSDSIRLLFSPDSAHITMPKLENLIPIWHYLFSPAVLKDELVRMWRNLMTWSVAPQSLVDDVESNDVSLLRWNTQDRVLAIVLGYAFLTLLGSIYLKLTRLFQRSNSGSKAEGVVADTLRQAGGVMKVIVIISIEMIVFPLYCGLLLDVALLPLFEHATVQSRLAFMMRAPVTGLFVHWFVGTCYMFHFALFVSMCRRIMRKGVLYFIRDPDDPTFHPVRDVLERPVITQLGKITFSALIYGGLVIMCLGGVVWCVGYTDVVLPIHWTSEHPRLAFPFDVIFYNFLVPFIVQKAEPSKLISTMYEWWFRGCATGLRLSHFLFGEEKLEEKQPSSQPLWWSWKLHQNNAHSGHARDASDAECQQDGTYVRAPANDSVRIPKGANVFLEVNENNERVDGEPDSDEGMHGKNDDRFTRLYIPPQFKARIVTFIVLLWLFAASTGVLFTVGPLLIGRTIIRCMASTEMPPNDLYALTVGVHVCSGVGYGIAHFRSMKDWISDKTSRRVKSIRQMLSQAKATLEYALSLTYLGIAVGLVLPFAMSLLAELYVNVPVYCLLTLDDHLHFSTMAGKTIHVRQSLPPTIFVLQTWTLGLLYTQLALRFVLNYPTSDTRAATATRAIVRHGWLRPNVPLATRALIVPATVLSSGLVLLPLALAKCVIGSFQVDDPELRATVYRMSYPGLLAVGSIIYLTYLLKRQLATLRLKIRDEVYLIGERLHNFQEIKKSQPSMSNSVGKQAAGTRIQVGRA